jgi:hypothetical protein
MKFGNRILEGNIWPEREQVTEDWRKLHNVHVGFEVFTPVTMKNAIFWDVALCGFIIN